MDLENYEEEDQIEKQMDYELLDNAPLEREPPIPKIKYKEEEKLPNRPKVIKNLFFRKRPKFMPYIERKFTLDEYKQPFALLMTPEKQDRLIEDVGEGHFIIKKKDGRNKSIIIDANKLRTLNIGNDSFKYYPIDENNATVLPINKVYDSRHLNIYLKKIYLDLKELGLDTGGIKFWMVMVAAGVAALIGLLFYGYKVGWFQSILG